MKEFRDEYDTSGISSENCIRRWRQYSPKNPVQICLSDGEGIYVKDLEGNFYMDFATQSTNVGVKNPHIIDAVKTQLDRTGVSMIRGPSIPKVELMEMIMQIVPECLSNGKFEFCNTGSDASEFTMQLVRSYTGNQLLISYLGGHYGLSIGTLSLIADRSENRRFCLPLIPGVIHIPYPYCYRCSFGGEYPSCSLRCLQYLEYLFDTVAHPSEIAAIFVEPMQQVGGVISPPIDYYSELRKICDENSILFVDDEVATGFGRTGKMFGIEHWNVDPDVMFLGKAIANGISMAGIVARKEIMKKEAAFPMVKGGSYAGNLISCVSAKATIEEIIEKKLVSNSAKVGEYMKKMFWELFDKHEIIGDVRGKGLLIGIEFVENRETKKPAPEKTRLIVNEAMKRGLLLARIGTYNQVIRLTPPLILSKEESEKAVNIIHDSIKTIGKKS